MTVPSTGTLSGVDPRRALARAANGARALILLGCLLLTTGAMPAQAQENLSLKGTAISSSETGPTRTTSYVNDNDVSTRWQGVALQGEWVGIQWTTPVTLNKIVVMTAYDRYKGYKIQVLAPNGTDFIDVATGAGAGTGNIQLQPIYSVTLPKPVTTTEVRFMILDSVDQGGVRELQTFYIAGDDLNLALQGKAVSSSESGPTRTTSYANDNDPSTRWQPATKQNEWVGIQWDQPVTLNKVVVMTAYDRFKGYIIQAQAPNGTDFIDLAKGTPPGTGNIQVQPIYSVLLPQPVTTKMIRFFITDSVELGGVRELEVFNVAAGTISGQVTDSTTKKPIQGAKIVAAPGDVTVTTDMDGKYSLVLQAANFNVQAAVAPTATSDGYFGRSQANLALAAGQSLTSDFVLTPRVNLARAATADASSESALVDANGNPNHTAAPFTNDGSTDTSWRTSGGAMDEWVRLTWPKPQTFNFLVVQEDGDFVSAWMLQNFDAGKKDFVTLNSGTGPASGDNRLDYTFAALVDPPVTSDQARFYIQTGVGAPGVREFQVYQVDTGTISGVVTDAVTKKPLAGIGLKVASGPLNLTATTDAAGAFKVKVPAGPTSDLVASRLQTPSTPGYVPNSALGVPVSAGGETTVQIALNPAATNLAFLAKASASTEAANHPAGLANDGLVATSWQYDDGDADRWLQLDWTTAQTFNQVIVGGIGQIPGFEVLAFDTAMNAFVAVGTGDHAVPTPGTQDIVVNLKQPVTTKQLQLHITQPLGQKPSITELGVFNITNQPAAPTPVIGTGGTSMLQLGDPLNLGKIGIGDATFVLQVVVKLKTPTPDQAKASDVDKDGVITIKDVTKILQAIVNGTTFQ